MNRNKFKEIGLFLLFILALQATSWGLTMDTYRTNVVSGASVDIRFEDLVKLAHDSTGVVSVIRLRVAPGSAQGSVTLRPNVFTYIAPANFSGLEVLKYIVQDEKETVTGAIEIDVAKQLIKSKKTK